MTAIWMGIDTVRRAVDGGRLLLTGDDRLSSRMEAWLRLSPFAKEPKMVA